MFEWEKYTAQVPISQDPTAPVGPGANPTPVGGEEWRSYAAEPENMSFLEKTKRYFTEPQGPVGFPEALSDFGAFTRSALQGLSFETADELIAGLESLRKGTPYEEEAAAHGELLENIPGDIRLAGTVTGGIVGPGKLAEAGMTGAKGLGELVKRGMLIGGAEGAATGAAAADPGERGGGAARGAAFGTGLGAVLPALAYGGRRAMDRITEAGGERSADIVLKDLVEKQGMDPGQVRRAMEELGPTATLADVSDYMAVQGREALRIPSSQRPAVQEQLTNRAMGRSGRIRGSVEESVFGGPGQSFDDKIAAVEKMRKTQADPLFKRAETYGPLTSPHAQRMVKEPMIAAEIREARKFHPEFADLPDTDMQILDRVYKQLGGKKDAAFKAGNKDKGMQFKNVTDDLKDVIGLEVEDYAKALDIHAGQSALIDAANSGRKALDMDPAKIKETIGGLKSAGENDMFSMGLVEGIIDKVAGKPTAAGEINKFLNSPGIQGRLKAAFPTKDSYDDFLSTLKKEFDQIRTERVSEAMPSVAESGSGMADLARSAAVDVALGMPGIATARSLRHLRTPQSTQSEVGRLLDSLYGMGPNQVESLLSAPIQPAGQGLLGAAVGAGGVMESEL